MMIFIVVVVVVKRFEQQPHGLLYVYQKELGFVPYVPAFFGACKDSVVPRLLYMCVCVCV